MMSRQIDYEEFEKIIVPLAVKIGYMPGATSLKAKDDFISDLYKACRNPLHSWAAQSAMFDKWATLNLDFKYLVESVIALICNYVRVGEFESQGASRAKLVCYKPLPECPDGAYVSVQDLLNGFKSSGSIGVVVPRLDCPKNFLDGGGLCRCALIPALELPENMSWLREILEPESKKP